MTERTILACGCVLGYERCFDCRPGLHLDQEKASSMTERRMNCEKCIRGPAVWHQTEPVERWLCDTCATADQRAGGRWRGEFTPLGAALGERPEKEGE